jgi:hypothetical protein
MISIGLTIDHLILPGKCRHSTLDKPTVKNNQAENESSEEKEVGGGI